ncbi:antitoxin [Actinophytocola oryzae]|uniref:Antitoxin protein of toxin-antitoxin system n=1 Tax=Actinophytocola oryzae TaxID=502181 RepID=A0A4R7VW40_9PSEU|nr:antitoxin [Actinophytocola oryzae]TDV53865.1 antitoxin protein of toxin-antitoxin system [Actinophytocola oryzae]
MPSLKKLTALAGTAAAARSYVRKHPDQVNKMAAKAGQFIDKRTKGKYHHQIDTAVRKVATITNKPGTDPTRPSPTLPTTTP